MEKRPPLLPPLLLLLPLLVQLELLLLPGRRGLLMLALAVTVRTLLPLDRTAVRERAGRGKEEGEEGLKEGKGEEEVGGADHMGAAEAGDMVIWKGDRGICIAKVTACRGLRPLDGDAYPSMSLRRPPCKLCVREKGRGVERVRMVSDTGRASQRMRQGGWW